MRLHHRIGLIGLGLLLLAGSALAKPEARIEIVKAVVSYSALHAGGDADCAIVIKVNPGLHVQSHQAQDNPLKVTFTADSGVTFGKPVYPAGEDYPTLTIGTLNVYTGQVIVRAPVHVAKDAKAGPLKISGKVFYQACDDEKCFLPQREPFEIATKIVPADEAIKPVEQELFKKDKPGPATHPAPPAPGSRTGPARGAGNVSAPGAGPTVQAPGQAGGASSQAGALPGAGWSAPYAFGVAFLAGLLFNIMPCVLPVLPIKAIGFYEVGQHQRSRSIFFGAIFSLGIVSVFVVLAFLVLVLKSFTWGKLFSEPWFIWPVVAILIAMAFSLFGAYTFTLPVGAYRFEPRHDTVGGNFLLGGLTAILATPCTAPLLPPLLLWATTEPTWVGVPAMVTVGIGMASPYLVLSALPELARKLPRTGPWAELFKQMMGFMLLAAAAYFAAGQIIQSVQFWWVVVAMVAVAALYLMARTVQLSRNATPVAVSSVLAVAMLGGILAWTVRITGLGAASTNAGSAVEAFEPYTPQRFDALRAQKKTILVKFTANWCATCQVIEASVFHDASVWDALRQDHVVALKADFTHDNPEAEKLLRTLNPAGGIPLTAIYLPDSDKPLLLASVYTSNDLKSLLAHSAGAVALAGAH